MKSITSIIVALVFVSCVILGNANPPENQTDDLASARNNEVRAVMSQFIWELYKDRKNDQRGKEILAVLAKRLSGQLPSNKREWIVFYKRNLRNTKELAPRIENPILRKALVDRNRDTEKLLQKLESGAGTKRDVDAYNARTIKKLKEALEEYRKGQGQGDEE